MFWALIASPIIMLGIGALIAPKTRVVRAAAVLAAIFIAVDALFLWSMLSGQPASTAPLAVVGVVFLQGLFSLVLVVVSVVMRSRKVR